MANCAENEAELSSSKPLDRDLYTIPISSSWFQWDEIHETERKTFPEFFDGSSISRNPRVYKEYRDFIICKYREDPSRRINFTEIRKSLIGDVGALKRVFLALDRWGLVNFGVGKAERDGGDGGGGVVVEDGPPVGMRVVAASAAVTGGGGGAAGESGFRLPPLSSYSDVFGDWMPGKGPVCVICGSPCEAGVCESVEGRFVKCQKCSSKNGDNEEKSADDSNSSDGSSDLVTGAWMDAETLLLLEAVIKHGDDWDLIAQHVRTKNKVDCIARLIQLPFGERLLGNVSGKSENRNSHSQAPNIITLRYGVPNHPQEVIGTGGKHDSENDEEKTIEELTPVSPPKKRCKTSMVDPTDSLMQQVALLSTVVGPDVAAAAADAAISALCEENPYARKVFDPDQNEAGNNCRLSTTTNDHESEYKNEEQNVERHEQTDMTVSVPEKNFLATAFQIRGAIATALGAAAAHAKLLADQEEREMEHLMASVIDMQLNKIQLKMKHFEELESVMEEEYKLIQQQKESILEEWICVLQHGLRSGIPRWRDHAIPWSLLNTIL